MIEDFEKNFGVFPTPVGMNRVYKESGLSTKGVPHARGDEPSKIIMSDKFEGCSPRPWG